MVIIIIINKAILLIAVILSVTLLNIRYI